LPSFPQAVLHRRQLTLILSTAATIAGTLLFTAWLLPPRLPPLWRAFLLNTSAALVVFVCGLQSALRVCGARAARAAPRPTRSSKPRAPSAELTAWEVRVYGCMERAATHAGAQLRREEFTVGFLALVAIWLVRTAWDLPLPVAALGQAGYLVGGISFAAAFVLLTLERFFSAKQAVEWPEALAMAHLARATLFVLLVATACLVLSSDARAWPSRIAVLVGIVPDLIAIEMLARALFAAIARPASAARDVMLADTALARLFAWPPRPWSMVQEELRQRFGLDLRHNWAAGFIRRALPAVAASLALLGWLMTGVCQLSTGMRGVHERLGKPVAVWESGLHWGLPWPLARTREVEYGEVHLLAAALQGDAPSPPDRSIADEPAPSSADRLWDVSHVAENAQVISSEVDGKQSFQIVNMDVRFVYRIGLSADAAMAATYHCADIDGLLRSTAARVMVHYLAARTLDGLLGERRDELARDFQRSIQRELTELGTGVEMLSVLIESIHPPAGAAGAYHAVQAAQIKAQAIVAQERGLAASTTNDAQREATDREDSAAAAAREQLVGAQVVKLGFDADRESFQAGGEVFLRERYFSQLAQGLAKANVLIIDHRIGGTGGAATIDLRSFASPRFFAGEADGEDR